MIIDRKTVDHVAALARLGLSDEESNRLTGELASILEHVAVLSRLDTEGVDPLYHILPIENVLREDQSVSSEIRDDVLKFAPKARSPFFAVPNVLEE